jgi:Sulfotransferase domain
MKPNFMVIGAAKCATTTVCTFLGQHPDAFMVECKEPDFFSKDEFFNRGFAWYESLYDPAGSKKRLGEGSISYSMKEEYPNTIDRITAYQRDLKLIYMVRDPFARIESLWVQLRCYWGEMAHHDFNTAIQFNRRTLVDSSNYLQQIDAYRQYYSDENILIIFYEDFKHDSTGTMRRCFAFLDLDPDVPVENTNVKLMSMEGNKVVNPVLSRLRRIPGYSTVTGVLPLPIRNTVRSALLRTNQSVKSRPQWKPEARQFVVDVLRDDSRQFLERYGKPRDFWQGFP